MNILVLSDIHANYEALKALKPFACEADLVLCLGDFVGYYCQVNEVLDFIRTLKCISVRGNHDEYLLSGCPAGVPEAVRFGIDYANRTIDPDHRRWLTTLPLVWGGVIGNRTILISHGSPFRPLTDYLYADRIGGVPLNSFDFDALAFGQTHRNWVDSSRRPLLLNPGSVGQSRCSPGIACAARLDISAMKVQPLASRYDTSYVVALARENGAGEWIAKHLP